MTDSDIRPLLVATQPYPEEGFHGLIARATHRNRLGHAKVLLEDVGLRLHRQGLASQRISDKQSHHLAAKLDCDTIALDRKRTQSAGASHVPLLRWGSTSIRSSDIIALRRRVCPELMTTQEWLPAQWSLKHLPFCAHCFSSLVDRCHKCSKRLGWDAARGVAACPGCRIDVACSNEPPLPDEFREDYRLLFDLSSVDRDIQQNAASKLSERVASLELHQILDLALGLGQTFMLGSGGIQRVGRKFPSQITAACYAKGIGILRRWPDALIEHGETFVASGKEQEQHFWQNLKRLRHSGTKDRFPGSFFRAELPGLLDRRRLSVASLRSSVMGARELQLATGLQAPQIRTLRDAGVLGEVYATGTDVRSFQVSRGIGDELARAMRRTVPLGAASNRLGLPIYTVEQLACVGELEAVDHPALVCLGSSPRITIESLTGLISKLSRHGRIRRRDPRAMVSLRAACWALHCGEKPYAMFISAMLAGEIDAHLELQEHVRSTALLSRLLVSLEDFAKLNISSFDPGEHSSFRFGDNYIQRDAADVLGMRSADVEKATKQGLIVAKPGRKRAILYNRLAIRSAAASFMSTSELAYKTGRRSRRSIAAWASFHGLRRGALGWPRRETLLRLAELGKETQPHRVRQHVGA